MSVRWSTAVLVGALLLALSNQLLGRACYDAVPAVDPPARAAGESLPARRALDVYLACLDSLAVRPLAVRPSSGVGGGAEPVEPVPVQVYRRACGAALGTPAFAEYQRRYGAAALSVIRSVAEAEMASAAEFLLTPQAETVGADLVWMAAFGRIAARTRGFHADLSSMLDVDPMPAASPAAVVP